MRGNDVLPCRTIESETRTIRIKRTADIARIEPRPAGLNDEIFRSFDSRSANGNGDRRHAQAALPKPIRLFDKVT
jgi:hypothetical protein